MSSDDYDDREEIRAIIASEKDKKKPRTAIHRGRFGIMGDEPLRKPRRVAIINGTIKLIKGEWDDGIINSRR